MIGNRNEWRNLYPFEGKFFDLDREKMHYVDEGEGHPVLMVHGNPTWSFYYRNLVHGLAANGFRAIAPDHIGCGLSTKPQKYRYRLAQHIENLDRLVGSLRLESFDLVVHDWGGAIGMGLAMRHPEKVRRIVLLNTAAFLSEQIPWRIDICRKPIFGPLAIRGFNAFAGAATWMATGYEGRLPKVVADGYLAPYRNWHDRIATLRFVQDIPMNLSHPTYEMMKKIESALPLFRDRPVQIHWGGKDFCFNDGFLARWQKEWPQADLHYYEKAGHYVLEDAFDEIGPKILEFLK